MPDYPFKQTAEIQITCPRCGYRMIRTVARLRRETKILCPSCGGTVAAHGADRLDGKQKRGGAKEIQMTTEQLYVKVGEWYWGAKCPECGEMTAHAHDPMRGQD